MSATTTIRVSREVHERLLRIGRDRGQQLVDVISDAADALERRQFAEVVRAEMDVLRSDPAAWAAYTADFELAAADGIA
jgi:hypothetical protein